MKNIVYGILGILGLMFLFNACSTTTIEGDPIVPNTPFNPFDTINYNTDGMIPMEVDSASFLGLHHFIFSQSCNQPACHDGTFEPDFRTVQSAYSSLVLHPVTKNTANNDYPYRVTPSDTSLSMMYRRITVHQPPNFEQMPSSGVPLSQQKIKLIADWIMDGAKDIYGNEATQQSIQPICYGVVAYLPNNDNFRIDTIRGESNFNPFYAPIGENLDLWFLYLDVTSENDTIFGNSLTYNKIQLSTNPIDFNDAIELNMTLEFIPKFENSVFSSYVNFAAPHFQRVSFNPSDYGFEEGDQVYIRTFVKDSDHSVPTEIPKAESPIYLQSYFSFSLQ